MLATGGHQRLHEVQGLACLVQLLAKLLLHPEQARRLGGTHKAALTPPDKEVGLRLDVALVGPGAARLVPDAYAASGEACGL